MEIKLLIAGILTGILVSVPVGPMGIFVVRKTVNQGWWAGFRSGLGLTTADVIFATIATIGLSVVIAFIREKELMFKLIGGVVVLLLGINIFLTSPRTLFRNRRHKRNQGFFRDYLSVVMLIAGSRSWSRFGRILADIDHGVVTLPQKTQVSECLLVQ